MDVSLIKPRNSHTEEELEVLRECFRVWMITAQSAAPNEKHSEPEYEYYFDCPACKWQGFQGGFAGTVIGACPECIALPLWGGRWDRGCEELETSLYERWRLETFILWRNPDLSKRRVRSRAWGMIKGFEMLLYPTH